MFFGLASGTGSPHYLHLCYTIYGWEMIKIPCTLMRILGQAVSGTYNETNSSNRGNWKTYNLSGPAKILQNKKYSKKHSCKIKAQY